MTHTRFILNSVMLGLCFLTGVWFLTDKLFFAPVPWPDGSAFYLPGIELLSWPPRWRMHAQAAFVPSYDVANFNTMPGLPLLLGLGERLGLGSLFGPTMMTRVLSLSALLAWVWVLWSWARDGLSRSALDRKWVYFVAAALALAGLWDPVNRWGTMVVRTETWIGLAGIYLLREFSRKGREISRGGALPLWRISGALALAAYFHFEAIVLVPATAVALWPWAMPFNRALRIWFARMLQITFKTSALLAPWILYVLLNFGLFVEQMDVQFHRLERGNHYFKTAYSIFHNLFISLGSPVSWPKFFNVGKGLFWGILLLLSVRTILLILKSWRERKTADKKDEKNEGSLALPSIVGGALMFGVSYYLWFTKPEVWFTTHCHLFIWPWLLALLLHEYRTGGGWVANGAAIATACFAVISLSATVVQQSQISEAYSHRNFQKWVDCIDRVISQGGYQSVWQPHVPDILVELSHRRPNLDLTRAMDFERQAHLAWELTKRTDVILLSRQLPEETEVYQGDAREMDRELLKDGVEVPYGPWVLNRFPAEHATPWNSKVCQVGPFWAYLALRR